MSKTPLEKARELAVRMHDDPHNGDYCWRLAVDTFVSILDRIIAEERAEPALRPQSGQPEPGDVMAAIHTLDKYINDGAPLPPDDHPYWKACEALETLTRYEVKRKIEETGK
jgi:hypothetical protein